MKFNKTFIILIVIFLFGLFLRLYRLNDLPGNFHEDEVLNGYLGRFILENGKDLYGNTYPLLYFNKFGDYYIILPMYLSGIATYIFGVNEFATRFPAALFGALAVFPVFFLTRRLFQNTAIAVLAAFLSAITPWQLVLARSTTEGVIGSTVFLFGVTALLTSIEKQNIRLLMGSSLLFLFSYFIYHPFRLYTPVIFLPLYFLFKNQLKNKTFFTYFLIVNIIFFILTIYISTTFWGKGRFDQTSIFSPISGVSIKTQELIFSEGNQKILLARTFHNKPIGFAREFLAQYFSYTSPVFLFLQGWGGSRYIIPEQGLLFLTYFALVLLALIPSVLIKIKINIKYLIYCVFLLIIAPIPAAFTVVGSPNTHRALFFSYIFIIFAAFGFYKSFFFTYKRIPLGYILSFFLLLEFVYFWHQYSSHTDLYSSVFRNDGQKQVALFAAKKEKEYEKVYLPSEGAMSWYYLFFNKDFNPSYAGRFRLDARIDNTNNTYYIEDSCPTRVISDSELKKNIIVLDRHSCPSDEKRFDILTRIYDVNELLAYKVFIPKQ